jgi:hypothetical protein
MPKQRKQARGKQNAGKPGAKGEHSAICGSETGKKMRQKSATSMRVRTPKAKVKEIKKGFNAVETTMDENVPALQQQLSVLSQQLANSQPQASNPAIAANPKQENSSRSSSTRKSRHLFRFERMSGESR